MTLDHRDVRSRPSGPRSATERAICGLSGGVDSAVAAALVHKAIGDQLTCVFVDTGLMRQGEGEQVDRDVPAPVQGIELVHVEAARPVPRRARRRRRSRGASARPSASCSSGSSRRTPAASTDARFLVQGTLYPDVIESGTQGGQDQEPPQRGRAPRGHGLRAGRAAARPVQGRGAPGRRPSSGCPTRSCGASRSPARASACASSARSPPSKVAILQHADAIVREEIRSAGLEREIWQAFAVLPDIRIGGRHGRRAHLRLPDHHPGRHQRRRHDRRLGPPALRPARADVEPHHQRGRRASTGSPTTSPRSRPAPSSGNDPTCEVPVGRSVSTRNHGAGSTRA